MQTSYRFAFVRTLVLSFAALVAFAFSSHANAAYPDRPIRLVVPFPAGGALDVLARAYGEHLTRVLKQPVVIDNRTGASARLGTQYVARSAPDGYTLLFTNTAFVQALLLPGEQLYQINEFAPVAEFSLSPIVFSVPTSLNVSTFKEFSDLVRSRKTVYSYGSAGTGQTVHFYGELLRLRSGLDLQAVPYRGEVPFLTDLVAGHVTSGFATVASVRPYLAAGKLKALAVPGKQRSPLLPQVPTLRELGYDDFDAVGWFGMLAPVGTPHEIISQLNKTANEFLSQPEIARRIADMGLVSIGGTPDAFGTTVRDSAVQWGAIVKASGIKLE